MSPGPLQTPHASTVPLQHSPVPSTDDPAGQHAPRESRTPDAQHARSAPTTPDWHDECSSQWPPLYLPSHWHLPSKHVPRPRQLLDSQKSHDWELHTRLAAGMLLASQLACGATLPSDPTHVTFLDCVPLPHGAEHVDHVDWTHAKTSHGTVLHSRVVGCLASGEHLVTPSETQTAVLVDWPVPQRRLHVCHGPYCQCGSSHGVVHALELSARSPPGQSPRGKTAPSSSTHVTVLVEMPSPHDG